MNNKPVIGILGCIGSGKSTAASCFADLGCTIIDADSIGHEALNDPAILSKLIHRWGPELLDSGRSANRAWIAEKVFDCPEELKYLNSVIHPYVLQRCQTMIDTYQHADEVAGIVLDMPLLLEVGWEKRCDFLVFVECSDEKRRQRVSKKGEFDFEQLKKRENFQISLDKKRQEAHYSIHNNSDKSDLAEQVALIFSNIAGSN